MISLIKLIPTSKGLMASFRANLTFWAGILFAGEVGRGIRWTTIETTTVAISTSTSSEIGVPSTRIATLTSVAIIGRILILLILGIRGSLGICGVSSESGILKKVCILCGDVGFMI